MVMFNSKPLNYQRVQLFTVANIYSSCNIYSIDQDIRIPLKFMDYTMYIYIYTQYRLGYQDILGYQDYISPMKIIFPPEISFIFPPLIAEAPDAPPRGPERPPPRRPRRGTRGSPEPRARPGSKHAGHYTQPEFTVSIHSICIYGIIYQLYVFTISSISYIYI